MGWFKQLCLSCIIFSACVSSQELTSTLREGNHACRDEEIIFTCTIRGSLSVIVLGWSSDEYIGQGDSLQLSTIEMIGEVKTSTSMDGNITAIATLMNKNNVTGELILQSTLRITATVASTVTCSNSGTAGTESIEFSVSVIPGAPQNVRAAQVSQDNDNNCIILVTWDPPTNIDVSDIDNYIITVPSRNIVEDGSSAIIALRIHNCHDNDSIQVAAVNRFGCVGENSLQTKPSLLDDIARTTGSTTSTPSRSTSAPASDTAVASIAAVLFIILCFIVVLGLVLFIILYKRGKKTQAVELDDLQNRLQHTLVKRNLKELYNALKLKLPSRNVQAAARELRATLMSGMESSKFNEDVKEVFISCLEKVQAESGENIQRAIENINNMLTGMTGIDEEVRTSILLLRTKVRTGEHNKVLDDFIKRVEEVEPGAITRILLSFCEKLQNMRQVKDYYCKQSKYDIDKLGSGEDRVSVPIWIDGALDDNWKDSLDKAVQAINKAAPGLSLSITENKKQAIIHVLCVAVDKEEPYTEVEGNILMRSKEKTFITNICLGKWKDDGKKGVCIHELLHALGFHHEHQDAIADPYVYHLDSGKKITINKNDLSFIRWDSSSTTLYPCKMKCRGNSGVHVCKWVLEAYPTKVNTNLDEHDMVGLNLVYPPCGVDKTANNAGYRPKPGRNGLYYCGREVMFGRTYPGEEYTHSCGPDRGPNCSACRTIKCPRVKEILAGGRWQGMTGRVYCGRPFEEPAKLSITHDGMCGMDNGPACPDCNNILNKEYVQSASV